MLTVEDGTIVTGADSFVTLVEADQFATANGIDPKLWADLADPVREARIRSAAVYLLDERRLPYTGARMAWNQRLCWPRTGATSFGMAVPDGVIPDQVKSAQLWVTFVGYQAGLIGEQAMVAAVAGNTKSESVGNLSASYFSGEEMAKGKALAEGQAPADLVGILYPLLDREMLPDIAGTDAAVILSAGYTAPESYPSPVWPQPTPGWP